MEDLDILKVVQTLYKLKSTVQVIVSKMKDPSILELIQESFNKQVIINSSEEEDESQSSNDFLKFLNRDEKQNLFEEFGLTQDFKINQISPANGNSENINNTYHQLDSQDTTDRHSNSRHETPIQQEQKKIDK